ncbi:FkbM family methyltransferase [Novipirellula rosea]|uniref:Methyltransferase FkbM domain-containing protein n=1 Tax=Novipirellula rosea TaxID=1031540 RepID=A0ABP8MWK7_9BACT
MKLTLAERLMRKTTIQYAWLKSKCTHGFHTQFAGESVTFCEGSVISLGSASLPKHSHRNRIVRDADWIQQMAVTAWLEANPTAKTFVDVGAFHGYYAISIGKHLAKRGGKVVAVEPDPKNFELLVQSVAMNGLEETVHCVDVGCSDHDGEMFFQPKSAQGSLSDTKGEDGIPVRIATLDSILGTLGITEPIDCLMVDVEGAELPVMQGCNPERIANAELFIELHPYAWKDMGYTAADLEAYLLEHNRICVDMFHRVHQRFEADPWFPNYIGPTKWIQR